jgi:hypothetical protein
VQFKDHGVPRLRICKRLQIPFARRLMGGHHSDRDCQHQIPGRDAIRQQRPARMEHRLYGERCTFGVHGASTVRLDVQGYGG